MQNPSRNFYSSLGLLIVLNAIIKPFWIFGIDRHVQNVVGPESYGTYFALLSFSIVFGFLLDWGLTIFFNRQLAAQEENYTDRIGNFLLIRVIFIGLYVAVVFGVALLTGIKAWNILVGVVAIQVFTSMFVFFRGIITAHQWFDTDAWLSVLDKTLMIFLCGSLLYFPAVFGTMNIHKYLVIQVACTFLAMLCSLSILLRKGVSFSFSRVAVLNSQFIRDALPFTLITFLMAVHYRLDGFLLERLHPTGAYEAGRYAAAYRLLDAGNMVGYLMASFLLPFIARNWSLQKNFGDVVLSARHLLMSISITGLVGVVMLAPWLQQILYHDKLPVTEILQWCLPALAGYALVQVYGTVMTATGHIVQFCYITGIAVMVNIALNLLLIPEMGAKGCCIAALVSQGICGLGTMFYVREKLQIPVQLRSWLIYIFMGLSLVGFLYAGNASGWNKWLSIAGVGILSILVVVVSGLFRLDKWKKLVENDEQRTTA